MKNCRIIRRVLAVCLSYVMLVLSLSGCQGKKQLQNVSLSLWASGNEMALLNQMIEEFKKEHASEAVFNITISQEEENTCKETVLSNIDGAADIFFFAGDQFGELQRAGALLEITSGREKIIEDNGGADTAAIDCVSVDNRLYAYPVTASNGYFLYYNSKYYTEEDVKSFDRLLEIAEENGKKVAMDFGSGWYIYSFFKGAGFNVEMNDDGKTNSCDWNATDGKYKGTDVAQAMLDIAKHKGFISCGDEAFVKGVADGTIIAGINGTWNSVKVSNAWGENYAAAKLPEYTIAGDSAQMCSFVGYKLVGVKASTQYPEWAMKLSEWLTSEQNQIKRFQLRGETPANVNAANSAEVKKSVAISALNEQNEYGYIQNVAQSYWTPTYAFGTTIAACNRDNKDLQKLLDDMQKEIENK